MEIDHQNVVSVWDSVELCGLLFSTSGLKKINGIVYVGKGLFFPQGFNIRLKVGNKF